MELMTKLLRFVASVFVVVLLAATASYAQTGTISGTVTDAATGNPLPGVNVVMEGTTQGATTDAEGSYAIINVSPGSYTVRATFVGYADQVTENVDVNINLTTTINIQMQEKTVGLDEVVVSSTEPVVKPDISANVANLNAESIENMPVTSVEGVIGLQAGVRGMSVRGGGLSELSFNVDGMSMTDGRTNQPFTGISYTAIDEVQVQTGGFNAEYGNVRSGLINVVTKEGPRDHYTVDILTRYSPPQSYSFGLSPDDPENYWMRPYLDDPEVPNDQDPAFVGTNNSAWDKYTQRQYPDFEGWNDISQKYNDDDKPENDLSPKQLEDLFKWYRRKDVSIKAPNYVFDGSFGGPVPVVSDALGDLRFFASYRQTQKAFAVPQARDASRDRMGQLKITANISPAMKLQLQGMSATQRTINSSSQGWPNMFTGGGGMAYSIGGGPGLWGNHRWSLMDVSRSLVGAKFTHTLSSNTFYTATVQRTASNYWTRPGRQRDEETVQHQIGPMELDEAPFGWDFDLNTTPTGMWLGGYWGESRDSSWSRRWNGEFDVTSQLSSFSQLKAGLDFIYTVHRSNHREVDALFWQGGQNAKFVWKRYPRQGAAYVQNKFEFQGMVANVGLRADYFHAGGAWYNHSPFDRGLSSVTPHPDESLEKKPINAKWAVSPRLGVSYPVTTNSKFFFNYGHFRQMLDPNRIYMVEEIFSGAIKQIGNPEHPMPQTISYELGYEQNLFNQFLLRLTGYYKDISEQPRTVGFHDISGLVYYRKALPYNYEDVRGFEVTLRKNTGRWVRGFANFTFMARKAGNFGFAEQYENPVDQREHERTSNAHYQHRPVPDPYARVNLEFLVPRELGPEVAGVYPLGDWRINWLGSWSSGDVFTWSGAAAVPGIRNNVRWVSDYNLDLRLSKNFTIGGADAQFFADISNLFNIKELNRWGSFQGNTDWQDYMESLHLSEEVFSEIEGTPYPMIAGNDRPGDYRKEGVAFVPIEVTDEVSSINEPHARPLYYENANDRYMVYRSGSWQPADKEQVNQVLEDKAYIDMPNDRAYRFMHPRRVQFGLRLGL